jgi:hypothetical protein
VSAASPPGAPASSAAAAERRRKRWRTYRRRRAAGVVMVTIPVDAALVNLLVRNRWLQPREFHTRAEITDAIIAWHAASTPDD